MTPLSRFAPSPLCFAGGTTPVPGAGPGTAFADLACSAAIGLTQAERSDGPSVLHLPSVRAEKHRARGEHGLRSKPMLRALTRCGCLSGAPTARSEFRSAAPRPSIAACPQRSGGRRPVGSPFFCLLFFGEAKKSRSPAGANSRPAAHSAPPNANAGMTVWGSAGHTSRPTAPPARTGCPHPNPLPEGEGEDPTPARTHLAPCAINMKAGEQRP